MDESLARISECFKQFPFIQEGWLFGSYAYGKPNADSDIDLCVIVDNGAFTNNNYGDVRLNISQVTGFKYDMDLVMLERHQVAEQSLRKDLVFYDIFHKGSRFYFAEVSQ